MTDNNYDVAEEATFTLPLAPPSVTATQAEPPNAEGAMMAYSIIPIGVLLSVGFCFRPADTLIALFSLVVLGWLPVFWGLAKNHFGRHRAGQQPLFLPSSIPSVLPGSHTGLPSKDLPEITILLPLYKEANMLAQICEMLEALDYPAEKLDCVVLLEADDTPTSIQSMRIIWPSFVRIMSVHDGPPQTKARACNYGLARSRSELVVVFDAEDLPHPLQLREAAAKFHHADERLACLQAPLLIMPQAGSWLQAQFALEYSVLFHFMLPQLSAAMSCLPLGGSSNYFRRAALEAVNGWDAHNLTEDADLALRLASCGYQIDTLEHGTLENAPHRYAIWHRQRTRWQSGHIQIMHVYALWSLRHGRGGNGSAFKWRFVMLAAMAVLSVRLLSGLFFTASIICFAALPAGTLPPLYNALTLCFSVLYVATLLLHKKPADWVDRIGLVLSHPFYWMLTVPAHFNALWLMARGETGWLKSPHLPYCEN